MRLLHSGNSQWIIVQVQHCQLLIVQQNSAPLLAHTQKDDDMAYANTTTDAPIAGFSLGSVFAAIGRGVTRMQVARMTGVLTSMSDVQLEQVGVNRNEISAHAEMLITGKAA